MKSILTSLFVLCAMSLLNAQSFGAAAFSSTSTYISTPFTPSFGTSQDFSVEFRVKTNGWNGDPSLVSDKDWAHGYNAGFNIALGAGGTGIDVSVGDGVNRADLEAGVVNDNIWHHVLVTFARTGNVSLYIDGILLQSASLTGVGNMTSGLNFTIAQDGTTAYGSAATCELAEVRVWNKVLPLNEVLICTEVTATHPSYNDLLHYWKLNETTGATTVADSKGTATGTVQGAVTFTSGNTIDCAVSGAANKVGAGYALTFDGNNDWLNANGTSAKVSAASLGLPTQAITVECWVNPARFTTWESMLSFIQDNGSFERGWDLETRDGNKFGFSVASTDGTLTYLETADVYSTNRWYHVAATYDGTTMKLYVNGILKASSTSETGDINYADSWLSIGNYKDDNESNHFAGQLDDVRIWNIAQTETQIRTNMCQKLIGNESGLIGLWRFDESTGALAYDGTSNAHNGVFTNMSAAAWNYSGASLGDVSSYDYPTTWTNQSLSLNTTANGNFTASNIAMTANQGFHVYRIDSLPLSTNGINDIGNNSVYYGVFATDTNATYQATYDYANYPNAVNNEAGLYLYNRASNAVQTWSVSGATLNTANNNLVLANSANNKEFILAEFSGIVCAPASNFDTSNVGSTTATIIWQGTGNTYNVQYGLAGFALGTGTTINANTTSANLTALQARSNYEVYIQSNCGAGALSPWVGPFAFSTEDPCPQPGNVQIIANDDQSVTISWTSPNTDFIIEWGTSNVFTAPGFGVQTPATSNPFVLSGLQANVSYTFFLKANCGSLQSAYVGPYTFTTAPTGTTTINTTTTSSLLVPNPTANGMTNLQLALAQTQELNIRLVNTLGQTLYTQNNTLTAGQHTLPLDFSTLPAGTYMLQLNSDYMNQVLSVIID